MPLSVAKHLSPRFYILGPGGVGSLFAYYFRQNNIPFTLFQRKAPPPSSVLLLPNNEDNNSQESQDGDLEPKKNHKPFPPTTLRYMDLTSLTQKSVEPKAIDAIDWEPIYPIIDKELFRYDPVYNELSISPILHLLVTTKTYQTVEAISKIRHRLRPWSTIVLMQNGMGVREEICSAMGWNKDEETPNFVQGIISHGVQKNEDTIVHTGAGTVFISPVIAPNQPQQPADSNDNTVSPMESSLASVNSILTQGGPSGRVKIIRPSDDIMTKPYPYGSPAPFTAKFSNAPFNKFYKPLSSPKELRELRTRSLYETINTFKKLEVPMNLQVLLPNHLLALQLSKLVVNACVNSVATLLEANNGSLLVPETGDLHQAVKDLLMESQAILSESSEYKMLGPKLQQDFLSPEALTKTTIDILSATRQNNCSTLQDYLKGSQQCEIDYMNGYLIKMAERNRDPETSIDTVAPFNRMVTEKIWEKFATPRKSKE